MLDANVVAAAWGLVGLFGVAITLLVPHAEEQRDRFLKNASVENHRRALVWARVTRWTPLAVVVPLIVLFSASLVAATGFGGLSWVVVIVTIAIQLGFALLIRMLVQPVRGELPILQPISCEVQRLPVSTAANEATAIQFVNNYGSDVSLDWVDSEGGRHDLGWIPVGGILGKATYAGHVWLVSDRTRTHPVGAYVAAPEPARAIISGG